MFKFKKDFFSHYFCYYNCIIFNSELYIIIIIIICVTYCKSILNEIRSWLFNIVLITILITT